MIDDLKKNYIPILKVSLKDSNISILSNSKQKSMISLNFILNLFFFNPFSNTIEPIIETTPFVAEIIMNSKENPQFYMILQLNEEIMNSGLKHPKSLSSEETTKQSLNHLNINISEEMIKVTKNKNNLFIVRFVESLYSR